MGEAAVATHQAAMQQLAELFPLHTAPGLQRALDSSQGSVEAAIDLLLNSQPPAAAAAPREAAAGHRPPPRNTSWGRLEPRHNASSSSTQPPSSRRSPLYVRPNSSGVRPAAPQPDAFPSLGGPPAEEAAPARPCSPHQQASFASVAATHRAAASHGRAVRQQQPLASLQQQQHQQQRPGGLDELVQQLAAMHPSCPVDLLEEVLQAVGHDAAAALLDLAPPSSCSALPATTAAAASHPAQGLPQEAAAAAGNDVVGIQRPGTVGGLDSGSSSTSSSTTRTDDTYRSLRRDAIRLGNKWQKALRRAAAARAAGDHSAAQQAAAEARQLKQQADAAHAEAALKTEVMANAASGLWELDLHGLHAAEALQALQQRLELLHDLLQDLLWQPGTMLEPGSGGSSRQQVLAQLASLQAEPSAQRRQAAPRELRVIVGKGSNSSGGESTLPRAVEAWLLSAGHRYVRRVGAIDVKLKRG